MPGCRACGIEGEPWAPDDPRLLAWLYHQGTSISRRRDLAPKDHQAHYLVSNLKLSAAPGPLLHSSSTCRLPPAESLDVPVAWAYGNSPPLARRLSLGKLSTLLARIAGETGNGTNRRRIVPTGGNLGSVRLWVLARDIDGLDRGAYLYDPREHSLAHRGGFDDSELSDALGTRAELAACVVLGTGDLAKCTQKYQGFAYRLIHFDAGIAVAFAHTVAEGLGLLLREYADFDIRLPKIFGVPRRWEFPLPTFALGIYLGSMPEEPLAVADACTERPGTTLTPDDYVSDVVALMLLAELDRPSPTPWRRTCVAKMSAVTQPRIEMLGDVLHLRRAVRQYSSMPPPREAIEAVMRLAHVISARRRAAGATPSLVRPVLAVPTASAELPSGVYEFDPDGPISIVRRSSFDSAHARECINQLGLARSPASFVLVGDLRTSLTRRMSRGYSDIAVAAGASVGMAWLAACSYGLVGTAAGGVIADGFREATGMDGFNECPLLALHVGLPMPSLAPVA
jgi:SagB-type dehydrogenase family enzyme